MQQGRAVPGTGPVLAFGERMQEAVATQENGAAQTNAVTMKSLLEAGVHFGHRKRSWNPRMRQYIFAQRNGIHIIDLQKTLRKLDEGCEFISDVAAAGQKVLFVGTKKQAVDTILAEASAAAPSTSPLGGSAAPSPTSRPSSPGLTTWSSSRHARLKASSRPSPRGRPSSSNTPSPG